MRFRLSLALCGALILVAGCGHGSVTLETAAGSDWPGLDAGAKTKIARSCLRSQAQVQTLPQRVRETVRTSSPEALVRRLDLYYRNAGPNSDAVALACKIAIEQRYAPVIRITKLSPGTDMPADERFLRIEGTVTPGAAVHLQGGERSMPAFVFGSHFKGSIEVPPGRRRIYATARFPSREADSRPILVTRRVSAQNRRQEELEEKQADSRGRQAREMKAAREARTKK